MTPTSLSENERSLLVQKAREALSRAYAPYSHFRVGAAVLTGNGNIFTGVNVENASYGLAVCAERAAIFAAVAREGPEMRIKALAVICEQPGTCPPCGACRQVISEFGADPLIIFQGQDGLEEVPLARFSPFPSPSGDEGKVSISMQTCLSVILNAVKDLNALKIRNSWLYMKMTPVGRASVPARFGRPETAAPPLIIDQSGGYPLP